MPDKTISSSLRTVLQKMGDDKLAGKRPGRDEIVKAAMEVKNMRRSNANRSWGDTKRTGKQPKV